MARGVRELTIEFVAEQSRGAATGGRAVGRQLDRELGDVWPSKAMVRRRRVRRLLLGESGSQQLADVAQYRTSASRKALFGALCSPA